MKFYTYILYNKENDKFYIGSTNNLKKRLVEHNERKSNYTSKYVGGWLLVYYEVFYSRLEAMERERYFKSFKSKVYIKQFIKGKPA